MREILFKAKRSDNGEWIEGCYVECKDKTFIGIDMAISIDMFEIFCTPVIRWFEVDPETLCQFTGLCDKNGKKVFENDILKAHLDDDYPEDITFEKVEWNDFGWTLHEHGCIDWGYIDTSDSEIYEVAGNVFDNPELLQEDTE